MTDAVRQEHLLSFLIGEVVRNDVAAESEIRGLWWQLHQAGLTDEEMQRDVGRVIKQVRKALTDRRVPAPYGAIAREVLERTWTAHQLRNKLVHEQWVRLPWKKDEIRSMRSATSRQLGDLRGCAEELLTLTWRLRGVASITPAWFCLDAEELAQEELLSWTRVAMGHIADHPGQVLGTPGPAPLPGQ